jgi:hypothetical protein
MPNIRIEAQLDRDSLKKPLPSIAFADRDIFRVEFPAGMSLYKVTQAGAALPSGLPAGKTGFVTPWWFSYETVSGTGSGHVLRIDGIADLVGRAHSAGGARLQEYLRSRGAVCLDWNRMTHLLIVALRRSAVGLVGPCSGQPIIEDTTAAHASGVENVRFIGGAQQLYIQGLSPNDVVVRSFGPLP